MAKNVSLKMGTHKSRSGGLTAKGRAKYNKATGSNLKAPQPGGGPRKRSFCARMSGVKGPAKKPNGKSVLTFFFEPISGLNNRRK